MKSHLAGEKLWEEFIKKQDCYPDIVIYGKALGNGYPISAVIGKKNLWKKVIKHSLALLHGLKEWVLLQLCLL